MKSFSKARLGNLTLLIVISLTITSIDLNRAVSDYAVINMNVWNGISAICISIGFLVSLYLLRLRSFIRQDVILIIFICISIVNTITNIDYWLYYDGRVSILSWLFLSLILLLLVIISRLHDLIDLPFKMSSAWIVVGLLLLLFGFEKTNPSLDEIETGIEVTQPILVNSKNLFGVVLLIAWIGIPSRRFQFFCFPGFVYYVYLLEVKSVLIAGLICFCLTIAPRLSARIFGSKSAMMLLIFMSIFLVPVVVAFGEILASESPWGALNGRQLIWGLSLLRLSEFDWLQILTGFGIFGHVVAGAENFSFIFANSDKIHLLHNTSLQILFDAGVVGLLLWSVILYRNLVSGGSRGLVALSLVIVGFSEVLSSVYFPLGLLCLTLSADQLEKGPVKVPKNT